MLLCCCDAAVLLWCSMLLECRCLCSRISRMFLNEPKQTQDEKVKIQKDPKGILDKFDCISCKLSKRGPMKYTPFFQNIKMCKTSGCFKHAIKTKASNLALFSSLGASRYLGGSQVSARPVGKNPRSKVRNC